METLKPGIGEPSGTEPRAEAGPAEPREPEARERGLTETEAAGSGPATPEAAARDAEAAVTGAGVTGVDPAAEPPPTVPAPEGPDHARVAETHIAELGDRSVADILDEIPNLSTDELEQLYAYEVTHKDRKTVRRAIERAVQPTSGS